MLFFMEDSRLLIFSLSMVGSSLNGMRESLEIWEFIYLNCQSISPFEVLGFKNHSVVSLLPTNYFSTSEDNYSKINQTQQRTFLNFARYDNETRSKRKGSLSHEF